jgi:hypothetical protein
MVIICVLINGQIVEFANKMFTYTYLKLLFRQKN